LIIAMLMGKMWHVIMVLICIFPVTNDIQHLLISLVGLCVCVYLLIYTSSFKNFIVLLLLNYKCWKVAS
jgi:hypothetical protein